MKNNTGAAAAKAKNTVGNQRPPENKDNLDSRKNEEYDYKGDNVLHNNKPTKEDKQKKKEA